MAKVPKYTDVVKEWGVPRRGNPKSRYLETLGWWDAMRWWISTFPSRRNSSASRRTYVVYMLTVGI